MKVALNIDTVEGESERGSMLFEDALFDPKVVTVRTWRRVDAVGSRTKL